MDHERRNTYCAKCGNNVMCTFRETGKTEQEIIRRCARYNDWLGSDKFLKIIAEIEDNLTP